MTMIIDQPISLATRMRRSFELDAASTPYVMPEGFPRATLA
jgi:hypothetical protein